MNKIVLKLTSQIYCIYKICKNFKNCLTLLNFIQGVKTVLHMHKCNVM